MPLSADTAAQYRDYFAGNRGEERAKLNHKNFIAPFARWIGGADVTTHVLMQYRQSLIRASSKDGAPGRPAITRAASSRNRHLGAVKAYLNWSRKMGYIKLHKDEIYDALEPFPVGRKTPEPLTEEEIVAMLVAMTEHEDKPRVRGITRFIVLGLLLGARPGEIRALRWYHIDWARRLVRIPEPKNNRERVVPMDSPLLERFLRTWHFVDEGDPGAAIAGLGDRVNPGRWKPIFEAAGIGQHTLKVLRTTSVAYYASAKSGVEAEYLIEARYGHTSGVSKKFYRQPIWQVRGRGPQIEHIYGPTVVRELERVLAREEEKVYGNRNQKPRKAPARQGREPEGEREQEGKEPKALGEGASQGEASPEEAE